MNRCWLVKRQFQCDGQNQDMIHNAWPHHVVNQEFLYAFCVSQSNWHALLLYSRCVLSCIALQLFCFIMSWLLIYYHYCWPWLLNPLCHEFINSYMLAAILHLTCSTDPGVHCTVLCRIAIILLHIAMIIILTADCS